MFYSRSKNIEIKYHYIHELDQDKEIEFEFCSYENQVTDIFTKPLKTNVCLKLKKMMGILKLKDLV